MQRRVGPTERRSARDTSPHPSLSPPPHSYSSCQTTPNAHPATSTTSTTTSSHTTLTSAIEVPSSRPGGRLRLLPATLAYIQHEQCCSYRPPNGRPSNGLLAAGDTRAHPTSPSSPLSPTTASPPRCTAHHSSDARALPPFQPSSYTFALTRCHPLAPIPPTDLLFSRPAWRTPVCGRHRTHKRRHRGRHPDGHGVIKFAPYDESPTGHAHAALRRKPLPTILRECAADNLPVLHCNVARAAAMA
ncbi:hypothetical protein BC628DRAFT_790711 [Trametes gibbosa]|nr:hypothetical protein BC628DRAFT_790711 [Trametes gibbosa]